MTTFTFCVIVSKALNFNKYIWCQEVWEIIQSCEMCITKLWNMCYFSLMESQTRKGASQKIVQLSLKTGLNNFISEISAALCYILCNGIVFWISLLWLFSRSEWNYFSHCFFSCRTSLLRKYPLLYFLGSILSICVCLLHCWYLGRILKGNQNSVDLVYDGKCGGKEWLEGGGGDHIS